jgi:tripartite-type tricarboxylate transporter receptor subunit TctC
MVDKLHNAFKEAMNDPEFLRVVKNQTLEVAYSNPSGLAQEVKALDELFAKLVKELGLGKD